MPTAIKHQNKYKIGLIESQLVFQLYFDILRISVRMNYTFYEALLYVV